MDIGTNLSKDVMFNWDLKNIPMSEIDTTDLTCYLGLFVDPAPLVDSMALVGLINAPILSRRQDLKYQIVCGFRRVEACRILGWAEVRSRVLRDGLPDFEILKLAVLDNRSHRALHVVEQAQGIRKLSPYIPQGSRLELLSSMLGFPRNKKVFEKLEALARLPEVIQAGVVKGTISFEAAAPLSRFSDEAAVSCFEILKSLKLSQSKQTEIITWIQEIAVREDIEPEEVIRSGAIRSILDQSDLNRNQKGGEVRAYLRSRRFPTLAQAEDKFSRHARALKLNGHIHITPPPKFEGGPYTLRMTFKTLKDFDERLKSLKAMAKNPALKRLLNPFDSGKME